MSLVHTFLGAMPRGVSDWPKQGELGPGLTGVIRLQESGHNRCDRRRSLQLAVRQSLAA